MNLWIRSQDKMNLVKVNQININYQNNNQIIANYIPDFVGTQGEYYDLLGEYKTKERALEILNEIQNILMPKMIYKTFDVELKDLEFRQNTMIKVGKEIGDFVLSQSNIFVYEMPKE